MASQNKFLKTALRIIDTHPGVFKALEEFEKTGSAEVKTRLNFTIDREIAREFRDYCRQNNLNMSEVIETFIRSKFLKSAK